jgi:hypothetical protein
MCFASRKGSRQRFLNVSLNISNALSHLPFSRSIYDYLFLHSLLFQNMILKFRKYFLRWWMVTLWCSTRGSSYRCSNFVLNLSAALLSFTKSSIPFNYLFLYPVFLSSLQGSLWPIPACLNIKYFEQWMDQLIMTV